MKFSTSEWLVLNRPQVAGFHSPGDTLGLLRVTPDARGAASHNLDPILLDGLCQLLSSFQLDCGKTFILQGIKEIALFRANFPQEMWVYGCLRPHGTDVGRGYVGDLDAFDNSGAALIRLRGEFTYMDRVDSTLETLAPKTQIVVTSTFTAEPIEDSLRFWGDYLGLHPKITFAPYSQVFQELLSPASQFSMNQDGFNVILLNLADWVNGRRSSGLKLNPVATASCFEKLERHMLPNGIEVAHLNGYETDYRSRMRDLLGTQVAWSAIFECVFPFCSFHGTWCLTF